MSAIACSYPLPVIIPPNTPEGKFQYIYPPSREKQFEETVRKSGNIAIVKVYSDFHASQQPYNAHTEFRVLYGWGDPLKEVVSYIREETSCGKPLKFEVGRWYVAIMEKGGSPWLMKYSLLEKTIKQKGKPDYVYTPIGLLPQKI